MPTSYQPIADHLAALPPEVLVVTLTLRAIETILREPLPRSASTAMWWSNAPSARPGRVWLTAGWRVAGHDFRRAVPTVTFTRATATGQPAA